MLDKSKVWIGDINTQAGSPIVDARRVGLYDTTLRDGEQTTGVALSAADKLQIAQALDSLGIDRIEAGFALVSEEDTRAYELIVSAGLDAEIWGFCRALTTEVEQLRTLGVDGAVIEAPISDSKLAAYGITRTKILDRIVSAVRCAQSSGLRVCFFAVDATRSDFAFLKEAYQAAVGSGAQEVTAVDTLGIASPEAAAFLVGKVASWVGPAIPVHWHGHNDFGLATAGAVAAVRAGAQWIQGTVNGMGERAGNTNLPEVALALEALYGVPTGLRFERAVEVAQLVCRLSGYDVEPFKPITGRNLFTRESGAIAAQFHDPQAIEPFSCELLNVGRGIVLGKKSGLASIDIKARELGLEVPEEARQSVLSAVKALGSRRRGLVSDEEFREIVDSVGR